MNPPRLRVVEGRFHLPGWTPSLEDLKRHLLEHPDLQAPLRAWLEGLPVLEYDERDEPTADTEDP